MSDELLIDRDGHVLVLTLNAPERLNALSGTMCGSLAATWRDVIADNAIRSVVLTGTGRGFCAGAEVGGLAQTDARVEAARTTQSSYPRFTARHLGVFKPVITAVNGVCAGAGLHFVADSDINIASEGARFVDTHVNVGQVSALEPIGLARRIPLERVLRMVILGKTESLDACAALEVGLVTEVVAPDALMPRAMELAQIAASVSPATLQKSLRAIYASQELPLQAAYDRGYELIVEHWSHPDAAEGPLAFMEKREPRWRS
jgi:enoyl-CoA hydratase/carnithine racemase